MIANPLRRLISRSTAPAASRRQLASRRHRPAIEMLEERQLLSIGLPVTSAADSGPGTLRAAIQEVDAFANIGPGLSDFAATTLDEPMDVDQGGLAIRFGNGVAGGAGSGVVINCGSSSNADK